MILRRHNLSAALLVAALPVGAGDLLLDPPSGQPLTHHETLLEETGPATNLVLRYVAPEIRREGGTVTFEMAEPDMDHICHEVGIGAVADAGVPISQVIVSLMSDVVPRGQANPDVTQFFTAYRIEDGTCIWEFF